MVRTYEEGICEICGEVKQIPAKGLCMTCYNRLNRAKNHERRLEQQRVSRAANPGQNKMYNDRYKERMDQYYIDNRAEICEKNRVYGKLYYIGNRDNVREKGRVYDKQHFKFLGKRIKLERCAPVPTGYVYHHTLYDHADPEANIVLLTRSSHSMGHALLRTLGIEIEHINEVI